jgi:hypothetical protein
MPSQGWKIGVRLEAGEERMKDEKANAVVFVRLIKTLLIFPDS